MSLDNRCIIALSACFVIITLLVSGCNQPAPLSNGGAVDLSFQQSPNSGTGQTIQTSSSQGDTNTSLNPTATQATEAAKADLNLSEANAQVNQPQANKQDAEQAAANPPQETSAKQEPQSAALGAGVPMTESNESKSASSKQTAAGESGKYIPAAVQPATASIAAVPADQPIATAIPAQAAPQQAQAPSTVQPAEQPTVAAAKPAANIVKDMTQTPTLTFKELYSDMTVRGVKFSDKLTQLANKKVEMTGFMAPPLTAKVHFFVLSRVSLSICPFCSSDADWPLDIVVVYMPKGKEVVPTEHQVKVTGTLSIGSQTDEATGFVSLVRIMADKVEVLK